MTSSYPKTDILLPYKEVMTKANAGAIARIVAYLASVSDYPEALNIFGSPIADPPLKGVNFTPISFFRKWLYGKNKGFLHGYLKHLKAHPEQTPELVEIHSRCQLARQLKTARPDLKVSLYMHNDARDMQGGQTRSERLWLVNNLSAILFVSHYLKDSFIRDLPEKELCADAYSKCIVIPNEVTRTSKARPEKQKKILLAGRMVPEKGILEACEAAAKILPAFPEWHLDIVGSTHFHAAKPSEYEQKITRTLAPIATQTTQHGYLQETDLSKLQAQAAIALVPSLWQEPAGLTVIEALAYGCALITTDKGGIPEIARGRAEIAPIRELDYRDENNRQAIITILAANLHSLLSDNNKLARLQDRAWEDYPFDARNMAVNADNYRISLKS